MTTVEKYYSRFNRTMQQVVESLGGEVTIANRYCEDSQKQLIDVAADLTDADGLSQVVDDLTKAWPVVRAEQLTERIM